MIVFTAKFVGSKYQKTQINIEFATKEEFDPIVLEQMKGLSGWVAFSEDKFKEAVEKAMADRKVGVEESGRSSSEILRGTLYQGWCRDTEDKTPFEVWYKAEMKKINDHYEKKYGIKK